MILTTALMALVACDAGDITTGDDTGPTGGSDTGTTGGTTNDEAPEIISVDASCYYHSTGDAYYQWTLAADVDDPQGRDTIELNNTVEIYRSGTLQASVGIICTDHSDPHCLGSFKEADHGILCTSASDYSFRFLITDEDGNTSTKEAPGYQG